MIGNQRTTPFDVDKPLEGETLRKVIAEAGYDQNALAETLAISCPHEHQDVELVYRRVRTDTPYNLLVRLFWLGRQVPRQALRTEMPGLDIAQLAAIGLLQCRDGMVNSAAKLAPYHDLLLVSDFGPETCPELPADHVLGVGAASLTLAGLTVRRKVEKVLDLGTGAGIQAFLASCHAEHVVGTDTNPRALNFARFNAKMNGIESVEWRLGSLYEPVADEKFDIIVSNPPFVISPESRYVFRDTDLPGDAISEQVMRGVRDRLAEGGFACILFNWHHKDDTDWQARPQGWVADIGCDGWLICFKSAEPLTYAGDWLTSSIGRNSPDYGPLLDQWMAYYEQMGIGRISAGAIILRKRSGRKNWFVGHSIDKGSCAGSASQQIERIFATEDLLRSLDNKTDLLKCRLILDNRHRLEHELKVENGSWTVQGEHLFASEGIPFAGKVDAYIANLLAGCDGRHSLGELVRKMADRLNTDPEKVTPGCLAVITKLMQSGFLTAAEMTDNQA